MLRTATPRAFPRAFERAIAGKLTSAVKTSARIHSLAAKRPNVFSTLKPASASQLLRYATKPVAPNIDKIDKDAEKALQSQKLPVDPDAVTEASSTRNFLEMTPDAKSVAAPDSGNAEPSVFGPLKSDFQTIKETFELKEVPREAYYLGAAGTLPYLATSCATVFLSYNINHGTAVGSSLFFPLERAHEMLAWLEPIQIGYGASILSFLGAIHWGLEYAGYGGHHHYRRYAIGVLAPAIAWPTMLMGVEYALISQFIGFTALYFIDARATVRGWTPPWYSTYRFVLTFVVGVSIVISLIGRGEIAFHDHRLPTAAEGMEVITRGQRILDSESHTVKQKRAEQGTPAKQPKPSEVEDDEVMADQGQTKYDRKDEKKQELLEKKQAEDDDPEKTQGRKGDMELEDKKNAARDPKTGHKEGERMDQSEFRKSENKDDAFAGDKQDPETSGKPVHKGEIGKTQE